jgi:signal transduction histidine kinase/CHASE1-domain containing sensor protein
MFAFGLFVTAILWAIANLYVRERDEFRRRSEILRANRAIVGRLDDQVALLRHTAAMFDTQRDVTPKEFHAFVRAIEVSGRYPGIQGIGYAARVPAAQRSEFERRVRAEGFPRYRITPPSNREAWAIAMIEPRNERNRRAMGFDMGSNPTRHRAMARARDEGVAALTGRVTLVQETKTGVQPGFLLYFPLYKAGDPLEVGARRQKLRGFIYSPFRSYDFFDEIFRRAPDLLVAVEVYDADGGETGSGALLYRNVRPEWGAAPADTEESVEVAGHRWRLRYVARPEFARGSGAPIVRWFPIGGLLVALILAGLSYGQVRVNEALVRQTQELYRREFHQRLLARAGEVLTGTLNVEENLQAVAVLAVPSFADWCAVDLLQSDGELRRVAVAHVNPSKVRWAEELQERYPPDREATSGVPQVLRTGKSELFREIPMALLQAAARDGEHARIIEEIGFTSAMIVPISARDRVIGAISFVWAESGFHYDEEDLRLAEEIGARAAVAVENASLFADREREIAVRTAAEAQVREVNENLERIVEERTRELTASNYELEAFCYSVSHDLRGPLRGVDGFSKALLEDYGERLDEEGLQFLNRIRQAARRMDELITALLSLSRLTRAELNVQPVDVTEIARQAAEDARRTEEAENVTIAVEPGLVANADPRMVRVLLDNLISNAIKFSRPQAAPHVEIGCRDGAFFVRDNGVGFNPAYMNKLFAPFERLHSHGEFPGTGIGLATVQRIVTRHGGRVWAEGEEGKGATFYFTLE